MALSLILRGAAKPLAFRGAFRLPLPVLQKTTIATHTACMSQILSRNHRRFTEPALPSKIIPVLHNVQTRGSHMDHGLLWTAEKGLAVGLLAILPLTFIWPNALMDNVFVIAAVLHNHWGLEAVVIDYVRPVLFGNIIPKISLIVLYAISAIVLAGLLSFNFNDIGIGRAVNKLWRIRDKPQN